MKSLRLTEQQYASVKKTLSARTVGYQPIGGGEHPLPPPRDPGGKAEKTDRWPLVLRDQIVEAGLPEPFREFVWHPTRNFRADLCWPGKKLIVECDGSVHRIKGKWLKDIEKQNHMAKHGWICIRVTPDMVRKGEALWWVKDLLEK